MIQFGITLDGKKMKVTSPHSWRELTLAQLIEIESEERQKTGLIGLFSIVTGLDQFEIENSTDKTLFKKIRDICAFIADPPDWENLSPPAHIEINGQVLTVPQKVGNLMHGQIEILAGLENLLTGMPEALASIFAPTFYKEINGGKLIFERDQIEELTPHVAEARGVDAYAVAAFFFMKLKRFLSFGMNNLTVYQQSKTRTKSYYKDWLTLTDYTGSAPSPQLTQ